MLSINESMIMKN
jgi:hypothetical protein